MRIAPSASTVLLVFFAVAILVGGYYVGVKGARRSAFNRWQPELKALWAGEDIYYRYDFPTPPIMAILLSPFAYLPGSAGMAAWFAVKVLLTAASALWFFRAAAAAANSPQPPWVLGLSLLFAVGPITGDLLHGNINLWILFLLAASLRLFQTGRDFQCGLTLALAAACKVTPAFLLLYFLWKGAWRVAAGGAVGLILWLSVAPSLLLGPVRNAELLKHWADRTVWPYVIQGRVETDVRNQSLPGVFHRLFTNVGDGKQEDGSPQAHVTITSLSPTAAAGWLRAVSLLLVAAVLWTCRGGFSRRRSLADYHEFALALVAMLALSERSWKHHYVTLLPCYMVLLTTYRLRPEQRQTIAACIAGSLAAMTIAAKDLAAPLLGGSASDWFQAYGSYLWAAAAVGVAHVYCRFRLRRESSAGSANEAEENETWS